MDVRAEGGGQEADCWWKSKSTSQADLKGPGSWCIISQELHVKGTIQRYDSDYFLEISKR